MPLKQCTIDGKSGWKWGDAGKCYTGPDAKDKAMAQGVAIEKFSQIDQLRELLAVDKTGFDYDGVISTTKGQALFRNTGGEKWIITARSHGDNDLWRVVDRLKLDRKKVIFTGSNQRKVEAIKRLGIDVFYDNNPTVRAMLPGVVRLF